MMFNAMFYEDKFSIIFKFHEHLHEKHYRNDVTLPFRV